MEQRRKNKRVEVNLPIYCKFADMNHQKIVSSVGKVSNLSLGGMKIMLPIRFPASQTKVMDYFLELPRPYLQIKGKARIVWAFWDDLSQTTEVGMEMTALDSMQRHELETILCELNQENHLVQ
ncbi:MAG: PilZ domain-containing protein [Candidatus Firestonebacteria bacterium]|nr:PilZ domain-containing protein [Candidatus Firestonebacteria bacterium]